MSFSDHGTETIALPGHYLIAKYDITYIDACTWMSDEMESFLNQAAPYLRQSSKKLTVTANVLSELQNCAPLKYAAQNALKLFKQHADLIHFECSEASDGTADSEFVRRFFFNHNKQRQLLITHDQQLAADIQNCCPHAGEGPCPTTAVMTLWQNGDLITFDCLQQRKDYRARVRLEEMTAETTIYLDSSALANVHLSALLEHLKAPLMAQEKKARVLSNSLSAELRTLTEPVLREYAPLLDIVSNMADVLANVSISNGLSASDLCRDEAVCAAYKPDPYNHEKIGLGLAGDAHKASKWVLAHPEELTVPLLLCHGDADKICAVEGSRAFAEKGQSVHYVEYAGGYHELHNEPALREALFAEELCFIDQILE